LRDNIQQIRFGAGNNPQIASPFSNHARLLTNNEP
jgi:hypothetical protein